jgi:hypothetical protein
MTNVFEKPEDLSEYLFRIVDNGGSTADRYTVVFSDGSYLGMSSNPTHPQGVSMAGESIDPQVLSDWIEEGEAVDLALGDLPPKLIEHIMFRNNEGLEDFVENVERDRAAAILNDGNDFVPTVIALTRDKAEENDGCYDCLGKGIYLSGDKFMVKLDGNPEDDRGPYETAREVVLATLPDQYSFSGPEYHSTVEVMRLTPDPEVQAAVKTLEARREAEWKAEIDKRYS